MGGHNLEQIPNTNFLRKSTAWQSGRRSEQMDGRTHAEASSGFPNRCP